MRSDSLFTGIQPEVWQSVPGAAGKGGTNGITARRVPLDRSLSRALSSMRTDGAEAPSRSKARRQLYSSRCLCRRWKQLSLLSIALPAQVMQFSRRSTVTHVSIGTARGAFPAPVAQLVERSRLMTRKGRRCKKSRVRFPPAPFPSHRFGTFVSIRPGKPPEKLYEIFDERDCSKSHCLR